VKKSYVLDANAVLEFVEGGAGAARVNEILREAFHQQNSAMVSVLNLGEVYNVLYQRRGEDKARRTLADLSQLPLELVPVDLPQALKAGEIKAMHKIPFVDCVAAALAESRRALLVTSDRDFEKLGRRVQILWLARA